MEYLKTDLCAAVTHNQFDYYCQYTLHVSVVLTIIKNLNI
jgi:hypothetical protein